MESQARQAIKAPNMLQPASLANLIISPFLPVERLRFDSLTRRRNASWIDSAENRRDAIRMEAQ